MTDFINGIDWEDCVEYDVGQIGGPGIEVQIDESAFGRRKHNRGHEVETKWVFGGVEETDERRCFLLEVEDRTMATLEPLIQQFVDYSKRLLQLSALTPP